MKFVKLIKADEDLFGNNIEQKETNGNIATSRNLGRMLTKFGFVRNPEGDFSDDGNRFFSYKLNNTEITVCKYKGEMYISVRPENMHKLPYETYSKLPHYRDCDKYNNGCLSVDVADLKTICQEAQKEVDEVLNQVNNAEYDVSPILEHLNENKQDLENCLNWCKQNITLDHFDNLSDYKIRNLHEYYKHLKQNLQNVNNYIQKYQNGEVDKNTINRDLNTLQSGGYLIHNKKSNFWFNEIKEILGQ